MWPTTASPERNCKDHIAIAQAERRTLLAAGRRGSAHPGQFLQRPQLMVRLFAEKLRPIGVGDLGHVDVAARIDRDAVRRDELAWSRRAVAGCRWRCRREDPRIDWAVTRRGTTYPSWHLTGWLRGTQYRE
jgi:hypothetical protein